MLKKSLYLYIYIYIYIYISVCVCVCVCVFKCLNTTRNGIPYFDHENPFVHFVNEACQR